MICSEMMTMIWLLWTTIIIRPLINQLSQLLRTHVLTTSQMPNTPPTSSMRFGSVSGLSPLTSALFGLVASMTETPDLKPNARWSTAPSLTFPKTSLPMQQSTHLSNPTDHTGMELMATQAFTPSKMVSAPRTPVPSPMSRLQLSLNVLSPVMTSILKEPSCGQHTMSLKRDGVMSSLGIWAGSTQQTGL